MNGYINTRPLFEEYKGSSNNYGYYMETKIKSLGIKDYYIFQKRHNASGTGVGKANYYMSRAEWNRVKSNL